MRDYIIQNMDQVVADLEQAKAQIEELNNCQMNDQLEQTRASESKEG